MSLLDLDWLIVCVFYMNFYVYKFTIAGVSEWGFQFFSCVVVYASRLYIPQLSIRTRDFIASRVFFANTSHKHDISLHKKLWTNKNYIGNRFQLKYGWIILMIEFYYLFSATYCFSIQQTITLCQTIQPLIHILF